MSNLLVFLSEIFISSQSIDCFDEAEPIDENGYKFLLTANELTPEELQVHDSLQGMFGTIDNLGSVIFNEDYTVKWFNYPQIGINTEGKLAFVIGSGENALSCPLVYDSEDETYFIESPKKSKINPERKGKKIKLSLTPVAINDMVYNYITFSDSSTGFTYYINFRSVSNISEINIVKEWASGNFDSCCDSLEFTGASATKIFQDCIDNKYYPSEGVIMLLQHTSYHQDGRQSYSTWKILANSHPNLVVKDRNGSQLPLSNINSLLCSGKMAAHTYLTRQMMNGIDINNKPQHYIVHFTNAKVFNGKVRSDWCPDTKGSDSIFSRQFMIPVYKNNPTLKGFLGHAKELVAELEAKKLSQRMETVNNVLTPEEEEELEVF